MTVDRSEFFDPDAVVKEVGRRIAQLRDTGESCDYVTFVANGEPTLDVNLGSEIAAVRELGVNVAVITNGSLLWREDVRRDLMAADWVSVKVDAVQDRQWRRTDRPHKQLRLVHVLSGTKEFAAEFTGILVTETMIIAKRNDQPDHLRRVARYVADLAPRTAYLAVPTRPPTVRGVTGPDEEGLATAYALFKGEIDSVEYLIGYEGDAFSSTGEAAKDLLSITAVHPMREDAVDSLLRRTGADVSVLDTLLREGSLVRARFGGEVFYVRRLR